MTKLPLLKSRVTGWFLLLLFASFFVGVNFFPHTHVIDNHFVTHSHPFSSTENHQHSANGFELIKQLSGLVYACVAFAFIFLLFQRLIERIDTKNLIAKALSPVDSYIFLRPPPVA